MIRWGRVRASDERLMFPNPSRSYDEVAHGVRFWGHDRTLEVSFFVEQAALLVLEPETTLHETGVLDTFDANRERIQEAAAKLYARRRRASHSFSFKLSDSDI